jgi:integrase
MESYIKPNLRENTIRCYGNIIKLIKPDLGDTVISRINTNAIQKFYSNLKMKNISNNYIRRIHTMLRQALNFAKSEHLLSSNPTDNCKVPKAERTTKRILTDNELEIFMQAIRMDKLWYDFFYLEISTGLRRGEICALKWIDYNEENKTLLIQRSVSTKKGGGLIIGETKTDKGKRTILLPEPVNNMLKNRQKNSYSEWIFPNLLQYDQPTRPNTAYSNMKKILDKAGLPSIRFHDLRHTFATHALTNNVDPKTLSNILGHTNTSFTLDTYTHVTTDMQEKASGIIGDVFSNVIEEVNASGNTQT